MLATCLQHFSPWFLAAQSLQKVPGFLCKIPFQDHIDVSSFTSLYSIQSERAPALLVIEDTDGSVFGALLSSPIRFSTRPGVCSHLTFFAGRANTFMEPGRVFCSPANLAGTSTHGPATTRFFHQKISCFSQS